MILTLLPYLFFAEPRTPDPACVKAFLSSKAFRLPPFFTRFFPLVLAAKDHPPTCGMRLFWHSSPPHPPTQIVSLRGPFPWVRCFPRKRRILRRCDPSSFLFAKRLIVPSIPAKPISLPALWFASPLKIFFSRKDRFAPFWPPFLCRPFHFL